MCCYDDQQEYKNERAELYGNSCCMYCGIGMYYFILAIGFLVTCAFWGGITGILIYFTASLLSTMRVEDIDPQFWGYPGFIFGTVPGILLNIAFWGKGMTQTACVSCKNCVWRFMCCATFR